MKVSNAIANAMAVDFLAAIDASASPAYFEVYTDTQPAGPDTAVTTQTLLGTLVCSATSGVVSGRTLTFNAVTEDSAADADGTATWARLFDGDGIAHADYSAGEAGSGPGGANPDIVLNTSVVVTGGPIRMLSGLMTF